MCIKKYLAILIMTLHGQYMLFTGLQTNIADRDYYELIYDDEKVRQAQDNIIYTKTAYRFVTIPHYCTLSLDANLVYLWRTTGPFQIGCGIIVNIGKPCMRAVTIPNHDRRFNSNVDIPKLEAFLHVCITVLYSTKYVDIMIQHSLLSLAYDQYVISEHVRTAQDQTTATYSWRNNPYSVREFMTFTLISKSRHIYQQAFSIYVQFSWLYSDVNDTGIRITIGIQTKTEDQ